MKRIISVVCALLMLALPIGYAAPAYAQSSSADSDPVRSGLWQGYNWIFGNSGSSTTPESTPTPKPDTTRKIYVALGDSVAAGLGLSAVKNPTSLDTQCGRSPQAYSTAVGKAVKLPVVSAACSGATVGDIFTRQGVSGPNIPAQLTTAYKAGTPELITITAGANDAHWASFIKGCYAYDCATDTYTTAANAYLLALQSKLFTAFEAINYKSGATPPPTYITGYYTPTSAACSAAQSQITPAELNWIAAETTALNQTIQNVASQYSFVHYVPIDFTGHDICSGSSWIQGVDATAPFHPTATGQKQYAKALTAAIRSNQQ